MFTFSAPGRGSLTQRLGRRNDGAMVEIINFVDQFIGVQRFDRNIPGAQLAGFRQDFDEVFQFTPPQGARKLDVTVGMTPEETAGP